MKTLSDKFLLGSILTFVWVSSFCQEGENLAHLFKVNYDTPLTLDLSEEEESNDEHTLIRKKKKVKKKVFWAIKTKKGFTRTNVRGKIVYELFHVLKEYEDPPPYTQDFYWYDIQKRRIVNSLKVPNKKYARVLHGSYKKKLGDQIIEEGAYYKGMKHKRWVRFNSHDILQDKTYWWKGWPQESLLSYYDFTKTQLKEVIPVHYGEREGEYWAFHSDGSIAVRGKYKFDHRVGLWREYYGARRIKREVVYPKNPLEKGYHMTISREWDRKGRLLFDEKKK